VKVLLLEDDAQVAQGLVRILGYLGCSCLHVSDVGKARALVESDAEIGLALIDIGLEHGQSGEDFLSWLRGTHPEISRTLISGLGRPAGFVDDPPRQMFLRKPFGQTELKRLLGTLTSHTSTGGHS
jgi:DNA-binding NtrC family response regulator